MEARAFGLLLQGMAERMDEGTAPTQAAFVKLQGQLQELVRGGLHPLMLPGPCLPCLQNHQR